ncbi:hypothetical protein Vadar_008781 [Vaccinium darrowii]|uniref:Uncharacterized protein n=1 Tax=Vaccinium darrowii TaxID=229202 RepID=A0ACB7YLC8_9ERIC|nr:hypothetical protein Vadar_008781 [Vaccinium darrowii]
MSSRGRGGRGTRSSPRKAFLQPLQDPTHVLRGSQTDCRIKWTDTMTMEFLKSVAEDIEEHGRATTGLSPAACIRVANDLHGKFGIPIINVQVKNRYYALKKEWDAWVLLTEGPSLTGVRRDPETGLVTGPEHWWKDMIAPTDYVADMDYDNLDEESGDSDELASGAHVPKGSPEGLLQTPTTSKGKAVSQPQSHIGSGSGSRKRKQGGGSSDAMSDALAEHLSRVKKEPILSLPEELPNYDNVLDHPMEVATVRTKLEKDCILPRTNLRPCLADSMIIFNVRKWYEVNVKYNNGGMDPSQYNYMPTNDDQYDVTPNTFHPLYGGGASEAGNYHNYNDGTSGAKNYPYHGGVPINGSSPTLGGEGLDYKQFITDYFNGLPFHNSADASEINQVQWSDPDGTGVPNGWEGYCNHQNAFGPQYGGSGSST